MNYLICPAALTPSTFCEPSVLPFVIPLFLLRCLQSSLLSLTSCQLLSSRAKGFSWLWMSFPQVTENPVGQIAQPVPVRGTNKRVCVAETMVNGISNGFPNGRCRQCSQWGTYDRVAHKGFEPLQ